MSMVTIKTYELDKCYRTRTSNSEDASEMMSYLRGMKYIKYDEIYDTAVELQKTAGQSILIPNLKLELYRTD